MLHYMKGKPLKGRDTPVDPLGMSLRRISRTLFNVLKSIILAIIVMMMMSNLHRCSRMVMKMLDHY